MSQNLTYVNIDMLFFLPFFVFKWNYTQIASRPTEMSSGAWHKTSPLLTMPAALYAKSKVCKTALLAGWIFTWHLQLTGSWGIKLKLKPRKPKKKQKWKKSVMRFWRRVKPCGLTLESATWQWTSSAYSDHHCQKDLTQTFKKHQDVSPKNTLTYHAHLSWLSPPPPPLLFSHLILKYWTDIWTFFFYSLGLFQFPSISVFILSFFSLLFHFSPPFVGW